MNVNLQQCLSKQVKKKSPGKPPVSYRGSYRSTLFGKEVFGEGLGREASVIPALEKTLKQRFEGCNDEVFSKIR